MYRYLSLLLFIGLAWGQQNADNYFGLFNKKNFNYSSATIEEKAEYDAKSKGLKWFLYPAVGSSAGIVSLKVYFYVGNPHDLGDLIIECGSLIFLSTSLTAWLFYKGDKIVYPKDVISEDEKKKYADTFDKKIKKLRRVNSNIGAGIIILASYLFSKIKYS
tara:strand:+ start:2877 stop:3359 length:483 start_codon:yes stop_codon:yes gene_type:complete